MPDVRASKLEGVRPFATIQRVVAHEQREEIVVRPAGQRVVALTANAMDTHRTAWEAVGVSAFLTKPIDPELLAGTLARACAQGRKERAAAREGEVPFAKTEQATSKAFLSAN